MDCFFIPLLTGLKRQSLYLASAAQKSERVSHAAQKRDHVLPQQRKRETMCCMQKASVATERVSATLNAGQSLVLTVGLTAVLAMAASGGTGAGVTAGDLVSPAFTLLCKVMYPWESVPEIQSIRGPVTLSAKKHNLSPASRLAASTGQLALINKS